jgi:hypothetical protein
LVKSVPQLREKRALLGSLRHGHSSSALGVIAGFCLSARLISRGHCTGALPGLVKKTSAIPSPVGKRISFNLGLIRLIRGSKRVEWDIAKAVDPFAVTA